MEKIHGNMLVLGLSSKFVSCKHKKHVSMYFSPFSACLPLHRKG